MERWPEKEEIKAVVFDLNKDNVSGPDGYCVEFFQACWEIVNEDVIRVINAFF